MKVLITSPITPISPSPYSHRGAPAEIYADQMRNNGYAVDINYKGQIKDYSIYDKLVVYHGNDFSGGLNIFGGIEKLSDPEGIYNLFSFDPSAVFSIGIPMPRYDLLLLDRMKAGKEVSPYLSKVNWEAAARVCMQSIATPSSVAGSKATKLVIGDSHAISMYRPGWNVLSVPFKTLHGATSMGLDTLAAEHRFFFEDLTEVEVYFGNIDIRHHLCRQPSPSTAAKDLVGGLLRHIDALEFAYSAQIRVFEPLPIETEDRKVPKTGFYKGTPFFGSWQERNDIRNQIVDQLTASGRIIKWTGYLLNDNGELDTKFMERPRSVHLARAHYPFWNGIKEETVGLGDFL